MRNTSARTATLALVLTMVATVAARAVSIDGSLDPFLGEAILEKQSLFDTERFPNIVVATDGTVIGTFGSDHMRVRRSLDGGATWLPVQTIGNGIHGGGVTVDEYTGDILLFSHPSHPPLDGSTAPRTMYRSSDNGATWVEDTQATFLADINGFVPSLHMAEHGITLYQGDDDGRLIRPARVYEDGVGYNTAIYSDDDGQTWIPSTPFPEEGTGEGTVVELSDGRLYYNSRVHWAEAEQPTRRHAAWSYDGGETWEDWEIVDVLPDGRQDRSYGCMGGLVRLPVENQDILLFSNLDTPNATRERVTVWASFDGGETWPVKRLVEDGPSRYSSLAAGRPGTASEGWAYLEYENGSDGAQVARFNLSWVLQGQLTGNGIIPNDLNPWPEVSYVDAVSADAPIAWYRMNDATDSAGDNDATPGATTAFGVPGAIAAETNGAVAFDGTVASAVTVPDAPELNFGSTTDFSVEAWVRRPSNGDAMTICNKGDTNGSFWLRWYDNGSFRFMLDYGSTVSDCQTEDVFGTDQWHHVVATADRNGTMKIYVNGILAAEEALPGATLSGDISSDGKDMTIGQMDGGKFWDGGLDDFAVYDTALDPAQVAAHFAAAQNGGYDTAVGADSPIAYFPLGTDGSDATGNHVASAGTGVSFGQSSPIAGDTEGAARLDGTADCVITVDDATDLNFGTDGDFTIETWFSREPDVEEFTAIVQKGDTNSAFWIRMDDAGMLHFLLDYGSTAWRIETTESYDDGAWHHLVATADRDEAIRMFVDGNLVAEDLFSSGDVSSPGMDLQIGQLAGGTPFDGMMDEFALYDSALTVEQIQAHYRAAFTDDGGGIEGDLDGDGFVGSSDLDLVRANWGTAVSGEENGDANGDGTVNSADLDVIRANWGQGTPAAVPEPGIFLLLAGAILLVATLRK